jgi:putative ABC transport system permease protein
MTKEKIAMNEKRTNSSLSEALGTWLQDLKFAVRSLAHAKGLTATVVFTLALGIGANAAIFTLVRGVLLRPLVNRDEDRLVYIRQSARGIGAENATFSVPEIKDLREGAKTLSALGDFSTIGFTMVGLGEPRELRAGVVSGSYFSVMGLHPVLGRLLDMRDDGPSAAGAMVLTYRFWKLRSRAIRPCLAKPSGSTRAQPQSSACSSRPFPIRRTPKSLPTS